MYCSYSQGNPHNACSLQLEWMSHPSIEVILNHFTNLSTIGVILSRGEKITRLRLVDFREGKLKTNSLSSLRSERSSFYWPFTHASMAYSHKKSPAQMCKAPYFGRGEKTRTSDPMSPRHVR